MTASRTATIPKSNAKAAALAGATLLALTGCPEVDHAKARTTSEVVTLAQCPNGAARAAADARRAIAEGEVGEAAEALDTYTSLTQGTACDAPDVLRAEVQAEWLKLVRAKVESPSREAVDPGLDIARAFLGRWPAHEAMRALERRLERRHQRNRARFVRLLERNAGMHVELVSKGHRRYDINIAFDPRHLSPAIQQLPTQAALSTIIVGFAGELARRTRSSGFRSRAAQVRLLGTDVGFRFPTACARRVARHVRRGDGTRAMNTLVGCVEPVR